MGHLIGIGPVTLRYGVEASRSNLDQTIVNTDLPTGFVFLTDQFTSESRAIRFYADGLVEVTPDLQVEAGLYPTWFDNDGTTTDRLNPRIGVGWSPVESQWLRAFYREDTQFASNYTLSPVSTIGLNPLDLPLVTGGTTETFGAQWDAEWSNRFFTSVSYQHQDFDGLSLDIPKLLGTFDATTGSIDRVGVAANYWIGSGLGAFGNIAWNHIRRPVALSASATRCRSFLCTRDSSASPLSARGGSR